jgi:very-short-patch-repair endonuclease
MKLYNQNPECLECEIYIDNRVLDYSVNNFGIPLCRDCQGWVQHMTDHSTPESLTLYFELRKRNVPAELEKFDGHKQIDIAVVDAKVNIEVDGGQHNFNHQQALADLQRTYFSFKKGYFTLRIPNSLVKNHLEDTADLITEILNVGKTTKTKRQFRRRW